MWKDVGMQELTLDGRWCSSLPTSVFGSIKLVGWHWSWWHYVIQNQTSRFFSVDYLNIYWCVCSCMCMYTYIHVWNIWDQMVCEEHSGTMSCLCELLLVHQNIDPGHSELFKVKEGWVRALYSDRLRDVCILGRCSFKLCVEWDVGVKLLVIGRWLEEYTTYVVCYLDDGKQSQNWVLWQGFEWTKFSLRITWVAQRSTDSSVTETHFLEYSHWKPSDLCSHCRLSFMFGEDCRVSAVICVSSFEPTCLHEPGGSDTKYNLQESLALRKCFALC